ncbi:toll/interleukin-1 receptor domain-containing protein [Acinetobacter indicus]|uniref:toll/interleukin-1 receptor domain-containing protein n=1 Tax=Acinetobacter indicus TaxID=756892 RepID=UPI00257675FE|nr:toll/interleukin-1 receptor domain-containing protein [Acinetobacter indicus]MDM1270953.1 toll/interleukin-1 receptor domain-containing protein [Acinetobacter indicus]
MRFFTFSEMKAYAENETSRFNISMESYFNESIKQQNKQNNFDIFLSHSSKDQTLILGIKKFIEESGYSVYIDWVDDPQLDRANVNTKTADVLRTRMRQSKFLVYVDSNNATTSKWMPWELGYFDGFKPKKIGILPIKNKTEDTYIGQEYLGLYPVIEKAYAFNDWKNSRISNEFFQNYFKENFHMLYG